MKRYKDQGSRVLNVNDCVENYSNKYSEKFSRANTFSCTFILNEAYEQSAYLEKENSTSVKGL